MLKYRLWIEIVLAAIFIFLIFFVGFRNRPASPVSTNSGEDIVAQSSTTLTREPVPEGIKVTDPGKPSGAAGSPSIRSMTFTIQNGIVDPQNIVVYAGDILTLTFESKDAAYAFVQPDYGLRWQVPAGGSKAVPFQATDPGKFTFYCPSCGGPDNGPIGYVIAVPKNK